MAYIFSWWHLNIIVMIYKSLKYFSMVEICLIVKITSLETKLQCIEDSKAKLIQES